MYSDGVGSAATTATAPTPPVFSESFRAPFHQADVSFRAGGALTHTTTVRDGANHYIKIDGGQDGSSVLETMLVRDVPATAQKLKTVSVDIVVFGDQQVGISVAARSSDSASFLGEHEHVVEPPTAPGTGLEKRLTLTTTTRPVETAKLLRNGVLAVYVTCTVPAGCTAYLGTIRVEWQS